MCIQEAPTIFHKSSHFEFIKSLIIHSSCWPCALRTPPAPPEKIALQNKNWSKCFCKPKIKTFLQKFWLKTIATDQTSKLKHKQCTLFTCESSFLHLPASPRYLSASTQFLQTKSIQHSSKTLHYLLSHYLLSHLPSSLIKVLASSSQSLPFHLVRPGSRMLYTAMYSRHSSTFKLNQIYRVSHKKLPPEFLDWCFS